MARRRVVLLEAVAGLAAALFLLLPGQGVSAHVGSPVFEAPAGDALPSAALQLVQRRADGIGSATKAPHRGSSAEIYGGSSADRYGGSSADKGGIAGPRDRRLEKPRIRSSRSSTRRPKPVETGEEQDEREE